MCGQVEVLRFRFDSVMSAFIAVRFYEYERPQLSGKLKRKVVRKWKRPQGNKAFSGKKSAIASGGIRCPENRPKSFMDALLAMPNVGRDDDFTRGPQLVRPVNL